MTTPHNITISRPLPDQDDFFNTTAFPGADIRTGPDRGFPSRAELLDFLPGAHAFVSWMTERVDHELLDAAGPDLRVVSNFAVGYDNIDLHACAERGVTVTNTPDAVTEGTADVAFALLLAAARKLAAADAFARSGDWQKHGTLGPTEWIGRPVAGRTLCIVGAGRIGYATALRSIGWGMRITYVARNPKPAFEHAPLNAARVQLHEGLASADFISIHTPLTPDTRHLIGPDELARCKPTAVLVNTARGPVVDENALADALAERRLFAAGLDVFENEPAVHPGLASLDNVVMTPHFGSANARSRREMTELCADNIARVLRGDPPRTPVNA